MTTTHSDYIACIARALDGVGWRGCLLVALPGYRPGVVKHMAEALQLGLVDFRATRMALEGAEAARLPLAELDRVGGMVPPQTPRGLVLHNAEALLATKPAAERRAWLRHAAAFECDHALLVPVAIFCDEIDDAIERCVRIGEDQLPPDKLILRLAGL